MSHKQIQQSRRLPLQAHSPGFQSAGINSRQLNLDPILNIDLFHMSQPTFPPHPHAGFSAVTYILPESEGGFQNRDSFGDRSLIDPGAIHWTQAGSGLMHEEIPLVPGTDVWGFQIFVNLKRAHKAQPPRIWHAEAADIPVVAHDGGTVRVVAGQYQGLTAPLSDLDTPVDFLDVTVHPHQRLTLSLAADTPAFAFGIHGQGTLAEQAFEAHQVVTLSASGNTLTLTAAATGLRLLIGGGQPLNEPVVWGGPFAMNTAEDIQAARSRFQRGEMGHLQPSF